MNRKVLGLVLLVFLFLMPVPTWAQGGGPCPGLRYPLPAASAYEQITVSTTAIGFTTANIPSGTLMAVVLLEPGQPIRYRADGTNPTSTVGAFVNTPSSVVSTPLTVCGGDIFKIMFIRDTTSTGSATLDVHYYKGGTSGG